MTTALTKDTFSSTIEKGTVIVDFWAAWCGPCQMLGPVIDELSQEMTNITFGKLDTESFPDVAASYDIRSLPTLVVYQDGKEIDRIIGFMPKDALKERIQQAL